MFKISAMRIKYDVLSPDDISISFDELWSSPEKAQEALTEWCKRFETQGYYSSCSNGRISLEDLPFYCEIVPVEVEDKKLYTVIKANRAYSSTTHLSPCETLEEAMKLLDVNSNDIVVEAELHWVNARVKGLKFPDSSIMLYSEYQLEFFSQEQLDILQKLNLNK